MPQPIPRPMLASLQATPLALRARGSLVRFAHSAPVSAGVGRHRNGDSHVEHLHRGLGENKDAAAVTSASDNLLPHRIMRVDGHSCRHGAEGGHGGNDHD